VEALARQARPGHAVMVVPAFTGLGAPWWDAGARGAVLGLTRDSGLAEISAAAFDACALQTRDLIEAMRQDAPEAFAEQAVLKIDGGMAASDLFRQRLADLTGLDVQAGANLEATALGAVLFAGIGAGVYASAVEACGAVAAEAERLRPRMAEAPREAAYARWLEAVGRVRSR
jgi:glycerol kinase